MKKLLLASGLSLALSASCGGTEALSPLSTAPADAGADADAAADAATPPPPPPPDAGVVKRTVTTRNPLGGPAGNLLFDGDFEMSTSLYSGQYGWRGFSGGGAAEIGVPTETGGLCRSGLRCAVMDPDMLFLIRGASAKGKGHVVSGWAKVSEGASCATIRPLLIECDSYTVRKPLSLGETKDGWCHYASPLSKQDSATCIYVENTLPDGASALLDGFVVGPDDGTIQPLAAEHWVPEATTVMRLEAIRARVIATTPFERGPRPIRPAP